MVVVVVGGVRGHEGAGVGHTDGSSKDRLLAEKDADRVRVEEEVERPLDSYLNIDGYELKIRQFNKK